MINKYWINFAVLVKLVFTATLKNSDYIILDQLVKNFSDVLLKVSLYNNLFY